MKIIGSSLITKERDEQLNKHNRTVESDIENNSEFQLIDAASALISPHVEGLEEMYVQTQSDYPPVGWSSEDWIYLLKKPYKERLVIAGALIAAEIDRIENLNQSECL